jgi:hypothetical protein
VERTASIVTTIAYAHGPADESEQRAPAPSAPQGPLNNALIASFHAKAATRPKAAVIKADIFSTTSDFIVSPFLLTLHYAYK